MNDQAVRLRECARTTRWSRTTVVSLGVCGMKGGVGTTTIAAAMAMEFVQLGLRTLLVDTTGSGDVRSFFHSFGTGPLGTFTNLIPELVDSSWVEGSLAGRFDEPSRFQRIVFDLGSYREHESMICRMAWSLHRLIPVTTVHPGSLATCVECVTRMVREELGDRVDVLLNGVDPKRLRLIRERLESECLEQTGMVPRVAGALRHDPMVATILYPEIFGAGNGRARIGLGRRSWRGSTTGRSVFFVDVERLMLRLVPQIGEGKSTGSWEYRRRAA